MNELPDDVDQLKAMLLELQQATLKSEQRMLAQQEEIAELETKVQLLLEPPLAG
ncbi:hypothetical protein [Vibrio breoganii]|uniref:hypothetical protein n=1 Tax=Vibrio breoganii TaxID=553239 RepID=UPI00130009D9|nr:hypothetical protein [Vibrio breoganii]